MVKPNIRGQLLKERGLTQHRPAPHKPSKFHPSIEQTISGKNKTPLMLYLEQKYNMPIEEVLLSGSLSIVAKKLGNEVDVTTLSKWISRFNLRYTETNLPKCEGCRHERPACSVGICHILVELELWSLVELKKEEVIHNE